MPEEQIQRQPDHSSEKTIQKPTKKKHTLLIVIVCIVIFIGVLSAGGYFGYRYYRYTHKTSEVNNSNVRVEDVLENKNRQPDVVEQSTTKEELKPVFTQ